MPATVNCLVSTEGNTSRVLVETEGRLVAAADVVEDGAVVRLHFGVDRGHLPVQVRHTLVDAVFDLPALQTSRAVQAAIPLGDVDLLGGLRAHCLQMEARAAGATCLVDAVVNVKAGRANASALCATGAGHRMVRRV